MSVATIGKKVMKLFGLLFRVSFILAFTLIFILTVKFWIMSSEASLYEVAIAAVMLLGSYVFLFRFDDIKKFKLGNLEIELNEKIREADRLIELLKRITASVGNAGVTSLAATQLNLIEQPTPQFCHHLINEICESAKEVGVRISNPIWNYICLWRYVFQMIPSDNKMVACFFKENYDKRDFPLSLKALLLQNEVKYDDLIFDHFTYFCEHGEHKDPNFYRDKILQSKQ